LLSGLLGFWKIKRGNVRQFKFTERAISGVYVIEPQVFLDERGYFMEAYNKRDFAETGIGCDFVQDNQSKSRLGVLRGLHFQRKRPQAKLVRIISGTVFDVVVDLRPHSPTYGKWTGEIISSQNRKMMFIPKQFAHGFLVLAEEAEFFYKSDEYYYPEDEDGIIWNDPKIGIKWPIPDGVELIISARDKKLKNFQL